MYPKPWGRTRPRLAGGPFDGGFGGVSIRSMADKIIDIARYLDREAGRGQAPVTMALWGADGDRSRFALPLWRIAHLAQAERGVIFSRSPSGDPSPAAFVVIDLAQDPARLGVDAAALPRCEAGASSVLHDLGADGLLVCLGARDDREWCLLADGGDARTTTLDPRRREDVLFLAGECAGLLFLRDFADLVDDPEED
jgi:hypothetical protein